MLVSVLRYAEILFSRKRRYDKVVVCSGVDIENREDAFLSKCCDSLRFLQERDERRYALFAERIGRILGSASYTNLYSLPRVLEVNHSDILQDSIVSVASLLVHVTALSEYCKPFSLYQATPDEICRICFNEESKFQKRVTGEALSELEMLKLKQQRYMSPEARNAHLRRLLSALKD
jgi:hypothetical protein